MHSRIVLVVSSLLWCAMSERFFVVENPFLNSKLNKTASKRPLCLKSQPRGGRCKAADALMHCGAAELLWCPAWSVIDLEFLIISSDMGMVQLMAGNALKLLSMKMTELQCSYVNQFALFMHFRFQCLPVSPVTEIFIHGTWASQLHRSFRCVVNS